ncbi:MAG: futalosine hydrolase [Pseudomonadota bacterium]
MVNNLLIVAPTHKEKEIVDCFMPDDSIKVCGIGKVNTASFLTEKILLNRPDGIIMVGCAGAYEEAGLKIGDVAIAESEYNADEGIASRQGYQSLEEIGFALLEKAGKKYFNRFPLDQFINAGLTNSALAIAINLKIGVFATVCAASGTKERAAWISKKTSAICENMEGGAAAHVCLRFGVPFAEIRGMSNIAGERTPFLLKEALTPVGRVLQSYLCKTIAL